MPVHVFDSQTTAFPYGHNRVRHRIGVIDSNNTAPGWIQYILDVERVWHAADVVQKGMRFKVLRLWQTGKQLQHSAVMGLGCLALVTALGI